MRPTASSASALQAQNHRSNFWAMISFVLGVAALWVVLYQINSWLFSQGAVSNFVNWIFLPAAIRMLAVMMGGWTGVLGLFVGAMVTNWLSMELEFLNGLTLALLSALGPLAAVYSCTRLLSLPKDFQGLQSSQLLLFAFAGAVLNAVPHNVYFYLTGMTESVWTGLLPMLVGDVVGTAVVLYVASLSIRFFLARARS